jgi:hypothetical protein
MKQVVEGKRPDIPSFLQENFGFVAGLIPLCWTHDPQSRPRMQEVELMMRMHQELGDNATAMFRKWNINITDSQRGGSSSVSVEEQTKHDDLDRLLEENEALKSKAAADAELARAKKLEDDMKKLEDDRQAGAKLQVWWYRLRWWLQ